MADRHMMEDFLEDESKQVQTPQEETFRAIYRRRGSDLVLASTKSGKVQITRFNHRFKASKYFVHEVADIEPKKDEIKAMLDACKYQLVERQNVAGVTIPEVPTT